MEWTIVKYIHWQEDGPQQFKESVDIASKYTYSQVLKSCKKKCFTHCDWF